MAETAGRQFEEDGDDQAVQGEGQSQVRFLADEEDPVLPDHEQKSRALRGLPLRPIDVCNPACVYRMPLLGLRAGTLPHPIPSFNAGSGPCFFFLAWRDARVYTGRDEQTSSPKGNVRSRVLPMEEKALSSRARK